MKLENYETQETQSNNASIQRSSYMRMNVNNAKNFIIQYVEYASSIE